MAHHRWVAATLTAAGPLAALMFAPGAYAAPQANAAVPPTETIQALAREGLDVQFNWVDGEPANMPLALCSVTGVDTSVASIATVSVDCPPS